MNAAPLAASETDASLPALLGESPAFRQAVDLARTFAPTEVPILLVGETGTGKELLAQHIHRWSGRSGSPVDVNCAAIPAEIADSILFGHRRGAFSGAVESRLGLLEEADGGTLLLDELASLAFSIQGKLLRALESGWVRRLGETGCRATRFRIIGTSHSPLGDAVCRGVFRMDLLQRLGGIQITLPSLAGRGNDVLLLAREFASAAGRQLSSDADTVILEYPWPGNVRELRWAMERARWLSRDEILSPPAIQHAIALGGGNLKPMSERRVRTADVDLLAVCEAHGWAAARAASALGIHRATLWRRLRSQGISLRHRKCGSPAGHSPTCQAGRGEHPT